MALLDKKKKYQIQTIFGFSAPNRPVVIGEQRNGQPDVLRVPARAKGPERLVVALTDDQAEAVKADKYLILSVLDNKGNVVETPEQVTGGKPDTPSRPIDNTVVPEPTGYTEVGGNGERRTRKAAADLP